MARLVVGFFCRFSAEKHVNHYLASRRWFFCRFFPLKNVNQSLVLFSCFTSFTLFFRCFSSLSLSFFFFPFFLFLFFPFYFSFFFFSVSWEPGRVGLYAQPVVTRQERACENVLNPNT